MNLFSGEADSGGTLKGAYISACNKYRYSLWRVWTPEKPLMVFVMQNPSKADAEDDDPTIRRCVAFALREKMGGIHVVNVFAYRATNERELLKVDDPVGPENRSYLDNAMLVNQDGGKIVLAWGTPFGGAKLIHNYTETIELFSHPKYNAHCLGETRGGHPRHPLMLRADTPLVPWRQRT